MKDNSITSYTAWAILFISVVIGLGPFEREIHTLGAGMSTAILLIFLTSWLDELFDIHIKINRKSGEEKIEDQTSQPESAEQHTTE